MREDKSNFLSTKCKSRFRICCITYQSYFILCDRMKTQKLKTNNLLPTPVPLPLSPPADTAIIISRLFPLWVFLSALCVTGFRYVSQQRRWKKGGIIVTTAKAKNWFSLLIHVSWAVCGRSEKIQKDHCLATIDLHFRLKSVYSTLYICTREEEPGWGEFCPPVHVHHDQQEGQDVPWNEEQKSVHVLNYRFY